MGWMSISEAASYIGVNRKHVWAWVKNYEDVKGEHELRGQRREEKGSLTYYIEKEDVDTFVAINGDYIEDIKSREK